MQCDERNSEHGCMNASRWRLTSHHVSSDRSLDDTEVCTNHIEAGYDNLVNRSDQEREHHHIVIKAIGR